jgi:hypothetical protein
MKNFKIFTIAGGFYFFGEEINAPEGFVSLTNASMFRKFGGGKGLPGVASNRDGATVHLDQFDKDETLTFPLSAVYAILPSKNLYEFKGTTLNG